MNGAGTPLPPAEPRGPKRLRFLLLNTVGKVVRRARETPVGAPNGSPRSSPAHRKTASPSNVPARTKELALRCISGQSWVEAGLAFETNKPLWLSAGEVSGDGGVREAPVFRYRRRSQRRSGKRYSWRISTADRTVFSMRIKAG